jgi:kynurenine formamidase
LTSQDQVASLVEALGSGAVEVFDLTQPLDEQSPVIQLPDEFTQTLRLRRHEISHYDDRRPAWAWYSLEIGEHTGTHLDAPVQWISGHDSNDVSQVPPRHLVAPAVVLDRFAESAEDPEYLLTVDDVRAFENDHGPLPEGGWLLLHTGWDVRAHDIEAFLNAKDGNPRSPGFDAECARWIAEESPS